MNNNAAIYYIPDGFDTTEKHLMGRRAAGEAFLKAYAAHADVAKLYCYSGQEKFYEDFKTRVKNLTGLEQQVRHIPFTQMELLNQVGTLYYPAPGIADLAWQRRHVPNANYSLCGITHTTASQGVINGISQLFTAPVAKWDAIICTSSAVKQMLENLMRIWQDYLIERTGTKIDVEIQLPIIPLGVDYEKLGEFEDKAKYRAAIRQHLNIPADDIVFLFFGRLSFHAKANPLPMFRALELATKQTKKKCHLIMAGWFANDTIKSAFNTAAQQYCPNVTCHYVDGRKADVREKIWYAADIFTSLSDNIQESFGLTPLEAMAAGLPVVVSDWNGYRDSVRDGKDGFLIPSFASMPGVNDDIALMYETEMINYDYYIGAMSLNVAIDYEAVAQAYINLIENPHLRQQIGEQAQQQAKQVYDWRVIIKRYQELWQDLADIRQQENVESTNYTVSSPLHLDPMAYFQHYPTHAIDDSVQIKRKTYCTDDDVKQLLKCPMVNYVKHLFKEDDCLEVFHSLSTKTTTISDLLVNLPNIPVNQLIRIAAWQAKVGLITLSRPDEL